MASLTTVKSSMFDAIGHDPVANVLTVRMKNGKIYTHAEVSAEEYDAFLHAESMGRHYNEKIRGQFAHTRVEDEQESER